MAHFAYINGDNIVEKVVVVGNDQINDGQYSELSTEEARGQQFLVDLYGEPSDGFQWVQTSYSRSFRGEYAGIGYIYDSSEDLFVSPFTDTEEELT